MWWFVAAAFGVSWLADSAAHFVNPWLIAAVYPVSQVGIIAIAFAPPRHAYAFIGLLVVAAFVAVLWEGTTGPDLFLETIAAGVAVSVIWVTPPSPLRLTLLVAFGVGWIAGMGYALWPGWSSWYVYQGVRAMSLGMFCWANLTPTLSVQRVR